MLDGSGSEVLDFHYRLESRCFESLLDESGMLKPNALPYTARARVQTTFFGLTIPKINAPNCKKSIAKSFM